MNLSKNHLEATIFLNSLLYNKVNLEIVLETFFYHKREDLQIVSLKILVKWKYPKMSKVVKDWLILHSQKYFCFRNSILSLSQDFLDEDFFWWLLDKYLEYNYGTSTFGWGFLVNSLKKFSSPKMIAKLDEKIRKSKNLKQWKSLLFWNYNSVYCKHFLEIISKLE